jgi:hypothetical protein
MVIGDVKRASPDDERDEPIPTHALYWTTEDDAIYYVRVNSPNGKGNFDELITL